MGGCFGVFEREDIVFGSVHYYVVKEISRGGKAVVHLVRNASTHQLYALKSITAFENQEKEVALREVSLLEKFKNHPNLVHMYDHTVAQNSDGKGEQIYILLQYFPNGTVQDLIDTMEKEKRTLPENEVLRILNGISLGLSVLHKNDPPLAHCDIKPLNILLGEDNLPVIIDFGSVTDVTNIDKNFAALKRNIQEQMHSLTTPSYCPPELVDLKGIFEDFVLDERIDIWSLGCLLYALAFHMNPFDLEVLKGGSLRMAIHSGNFSFPSQQTYSKDIEGLISSMIVVNPQDRPYIDTILNNIKMLT
uniref:non-specific serine/threonine protein kinase n=1 Tax=Arcella intermedia TaxID=1963864 RepID=A0A6B2LB52_9EUKA